MILRVIFAMCFAALLAACGGEKAAIQATQPASGSIISCVQGSGHCSMLVLHEPGTVVLWGLVEDGRVLARQFRHAQFGGALTRDQISLYQDTLARLEAGEQVMCGGGAGRGAGPARRCTADDIESPYSAWVTTLQRDISSPPRSVQPAADLTSNNADVMEAIRRAGERTGRLYTSADLPGHALTCSSAGACSYRLVIVNQSHLGDVIDSTIDRARAEAIVQALDALILTAPDLATPRDLAARDGNFVKRF